MKGRKRTEEGLKIKISLLLLVFLTLTVIAYNFQFHNISSSMFLNAYKLPEWEIPVGYVDVTKDDGFRTWVIDYVIACDITRTGMKIEEYDLPYLWLKNASSSSKNYDMAIKYFDDFYFLQVRYYPDFQRTSVEHGILWTINIITIVTWLYFILTETPLKKWRKREKMKKVNLLLFALLLIAPILCQIRTAHATSCGYERYKDNKSEVYVEYFPIVPYDTNYPTASEEFPIKFYVFQNHWYENFGLTHPVPAGFTVDVGFRDDTTNDSGWPTWKRWYPLSMEQYGTKVSWTLGGSYGPLTVATTVKGENMFAPDTDYSKYEMVYNGETYVHMGTLKIYYNSNNLWGSATTEGAGSIGIPNDLAVNHDGHHVKILVRVHVYWINYALWPYQEDYEVNFVLGDDIPSDTDCWLTVQRGDATFSVIPNSGGGGGGCPTLFVWNGNGYVDYGVINIHNHTGEDVIREVPIQSQDVCINSHKAKFRLREGWEGLNFSESVIDQVKLYAVDSQGNRYLCPLISAEHSRLGNVLLRLLLSDDYRAQMLLLETVDLTFIVPWQNIQGFTFAIEGCNFSKW